MQSAARALSKDYIRRGWLGLLLTMGVLVLGPLAFMGLMRLDGLEILGDVLDPDSLYLNFQGLAIFAFAAQGCAAHQGVPQLSRGLPVSSWFVVGWFMGSAGACVVLLMALTTLVYRWAYGVEWSILAPTTAFSVVLVLICQCAYWNLHRFGLRRLAIWLGVYAALIGWLFSRFHPEGLSGRMQPWESVTPLEGLLLAAAAVAAYLLAVRSHAKYRCGAATLSPTARRLQEWCTAWLYGTRQSSRNGSPEATLVSFSWRATGRRSAAVMIAAACLVLLAASGVVSEGRRSAAEGAVVILLVFQALAGCSLGALAADVASKSAAEMPRYLAVSPLSDFALSSALLRNAIKTAVLAWLVMVSVTLLLGCWWWFSADGASIERLLSGHWLTSHFGMWGVGAIFAASLGVTWISLGLAASLVWTGRPWLMTSVGLAVTLLPIVLIVVVRFLLPQAWMEPATRLLAWCFAIVSLGGTTVAIRTALKKQLLSMRAFGTTVAICGLAAAVCLSVSAPVTLEQRVAVCSVLVLAVLPLASGPLAISWNRHR